MHAADPLAAHEPAAPLPTESPTVNVTQTNDSMGLRGWWSLAGNASAMVLIAGSFLFLQWTLISQNREDLAESRAMFKEALKDLQRSHDVQVNALSKGLVENQSATKQLDTSIRELTTELKKRPAGGGPGGL